MHTVPSLLALALDLHAAQREAPAMAAMEPAGQGRQEVAPRELLK